ncbi:MAG: thioredoxin [Alphaproteobacteria bacterium]|nr:thioredoxin [Alphaproteobacteria bacterium]
MSSSFDPPENTPPAFGERANGGSAGGDLAGGDAIIDVSTENFMVEVIEASQSRLVLLDLWAPWCGPCKQLTPLLEKLVAQSDGAVRLAKMNIDEHPAVAQQLQVQSIPAVFAFKDGQPVDGFMGALPESDIKQFLDKHLDTALDPSPAEALMETAEEALAAGQIDDALECYGAALEQEPDNIAAMAGLAQAHLAAGNQQAAEAALAAAPVHDNDPALAAARAALALAGKTETGDMADAAPLLAALEADANNHQARFDLALALHGAGQREDALDALLDIVARQRDWNDDAARKQLVELFDAYGAQDALVIAARKRLSSLLFS